MKSSSFRLRTTRRRQLWQFSVLALLGLVASYAATEVENPWIVLTIVGVLAFILLVPNLGTAVMLGPARLARSIGWWRGLWLVMFVSGLVFRGRSSSEISESPVDGWALFRVGCSLLVAAVLFFRLTFRKTDLFHALFSGLIGIFSCFGVISLLSTIWSVNPPWTLYRSFEFLTDVAVVAAIVATLETVEEYKQFVNWTWILLGLVLISAWIGAVVDPSYALFVSKNLHSALLPMRLQGTMPVVAYNDLSQMSAILALISLSRLWTDPDIRPARSWYWLIFVASIITLVITQTRGAYAAFLVAFALLLLFARRYWLLALGGVLTSGAVTLLLMFTNFATKIQEFLLRGETSQSASGLSGRLEIWDISIQKILGQLWTGYGGFAGSRFVVMPLTGSRFGSNVLNVYIDAMLGVGVWGLLLLVLVVGLTGWQLFRLIYRSSATQLERSLAMELSLAYTIIVISSMESGNITTHPMLSFLTVLGFAEFLRRRNKIRSVQPQVIEATAI